MLAHTRKEAGAVRNHTLPMMLSPAVSKQLAPFKNGDIKAIAVGIDPEWPRYTNLPASPPGTVEGNIPQAMAA
jgi:hypothetical protein